MQLLNLPMKATRLLCRFCRTLGQIVGQNEVRAVGRHLNPETLHFVVFGKAFNFESLAASASRQK